MSAHNATTGRVFEPARQPASITLSMHAVILRGLPFCAKMAATRDVRGASTATQVSFVLKVVQRSRNIAESASPAGRKPRRLLGCKAR